MLTLISTLSKQTLIICAYSQVLVYSAMHVTIFIKQILNPYIISDPHQSLLSSLCSKNSCTRQIPPPPHHSRGARSGCRCHIFLYYHSTRCLVSGPVCVAMGSPCHCLPVLTTCPIHTNLYLHVHVPQFLQKYQNTKNSALFV